MNTYLNQKFRIMAFFAMIMIVIIHSANLEIRFTNETIKYGTGYNSYIQQFISDGLIRVAVPLFSFISGYLFFLNFNGRVGDFVYKFKKRTKSLLIPYLVWSVWGLLFYFTLQQIPLSEAFFTNTRISDYSLNELFFTIFVEPIPYQMWFVRDLMLLVLCTPIIYGLILRLREFYIAVALLLWLDVIPFDFYLFTNRTLFFFSLGAYFHIWNANFVLKKRGERKYLVLPVLWLLLVTIRTNLVYVGYDEPALIRGVFDASILVGLASLWILYDFVMNGKEIANPRLLKLSSLSFFIFAFHEPLMKLVKKGLFSVLGQHESTAFLIYILAPLIILTIAIPSAFTLKRIMPKFYSIFSGGR